jgi:hypothetical protein
MVTANQLGVNWRMASNGLGKWLNGRKRFLAAQHVMANLLSSDEVEPC